MNKKNSVLLLNELVFDKITFIRNGLKSNNELLFSLEANISKNDEIEMYKVQLGIKGNKKDEYTFEVFVSGYFSFEDVNLPDSTKEKLLSENAIAILMPYLRSQVSLLTTQPGMECVVLQPFNINSIFGSKNDNKK